MLCVHYANPSLRSTHCDAAHARPWLACVPAATLLVILLLTCHTEAGTLQQRGERRAGRDALACFEQAAVRSATCQAGSPSNPHIQNPQRDTRADKGGR